MNEPCRRRLSEEAPLGSRRPGAGRDPICRCGQLGPRPSLERRSAGRDLVLLDHDRHRHRAAQAHVLGIELLERRVDVDAPSFVCGARLREREPRDHGVVGRPRVEQDRTLGGRRSRERRPQRPQARQPTRHAQTIARVGRTALLLREVLMLPKIIRMTVILFIGFFQRSLRCKPPSFKVFSNCSDRHFNAIKFLFF